MDDWNLILDTNLRGTFFVAQAVARHMVPARSGRIINIGSETCVARLCPGWPRTVPAGEESGSSQ